MTEITSKASRFEMRLTPSQKERLDRAAEFRGLSTSQWALTNLLVAADRDIRESHVLHLGVKGQKVCPESRIFTD